MTSARREVLEVVSAAYRLDLETSSWLDELVRAARPTLDRGRGLMSWSFRVSASGTHVFTSRIAATEDVTEAVIRSCTKNNDSLSQDEVAHAHANPRTLDTASCAVDSLFGEGAFERWPKFDDARALGHADCLVAKGCDPAGIGVMFAAPLPRVERVPRGDDRRWARVIAHVIAGLRLRAAGTPLGDGDAVLAPSGEVVHAEGQARGTSARDALRAAAVRIDRARGSFGRADPDGALEQWRALVAGRWSLVDRFDSDGRRFLVARRNDPEVVGPTDLSARERQVLAYAAQGHPNKYIAYVLGLAPSTVSTHLRRAMRRLGARTRGDLAAILAPVER
ncbi:MAG TPA: helix-turn-helix transcriptional regulator [Sandaracinaceae bacterium LLY-WYZ-13_1]|nr:helix-turn-helix transcriptional regulator [Sandaracinaceae bacterium LLY-WYZ-13_1]